MKSSVYPLGTLLALREREVEAAERELAAAVSARESAERAAETARARLAAAKAADDAVRADERSRLARGDQRGVDLARAAAWEAQAEAAMQALDGAVRAADDAASAARGHETEARTALADRTAARDVVAKDEARFREGQRQARLAAEEEEAADLTARKVRA